MVAVEVSVFVVVAVEVSVFVVVAVEVVIPEGTSDTDTPLPLLVILNFFPPLITRKKSNI